MRLYERAEISADLLGSVLALLGRPGQVLQAAEVAGGRIATNVLVPGSATTLIRAYPSCYDAHRVRYEAAVLAHLASRGFPVPQPLRFPSGWVHEVAQVARFIAYDYLDGSCLEADAIDNGIAAAVGGLVARLQGASAGFVTPVDAPDGDMRFIAGLLNEASKGAASDADATLVRAMRATLDSLAVRSALERSPQGIVHGDIFCENILVDERRHLVGLIDFGDAYYGATMTDFAIAGMEFSFDAEGGFSESRYRSFLRGGADWLRSSRMTGTDLESLTLLNCIRFACHTMPATLAQGGRWTDNEYVERYEAIASRPRGDRLAALADSELRPT